MSAPASRAIPLQVASIILALHQVALAADDPKFVLIGRGQVDGAG